MNKPKVVTLCGSTRFWEAFRDQGLKLTLEGKIVLSIGICAPDSMVLANPESEDGKRQKSMLDDLHKAKIDLSDEILVLNVGGYIGNSTRGEVRHALQTGKLVRWLEPDKADANLMRDHRCWSEPPKDERDGSTFCVVCRQITELLARSVAS